MYYWIMVLDPQKDRPFMVNIPFSSESRAEKHNENRYNGRGTIYPTDSRVKSEAVREIRPQLIRDKSGTWGRNFVHQKPTGGKEEWSF